MSTPAIPSAPEQHFQELSAILTSGILRLKAYPHLNISSENPLAFTASAAVKTTHSRRNSVELSQFYAAPPGATLLLRPSHSSYIKKPPIR